MALIREITNERIKLAFAGDGKPSSLKSLYDQVELLNVEQPGRGFHLRNGHLNIPLTDISVSAEGKLRARSYNGTQEVVFNVKAASRYLAFHIESMKGIPTTSGLTLHYEMQVSDRVRVIELDYMTEKSIRSGALSVDWLYLWHQSAVDPLGGFALYDAIDEQDEDQTLLHIWVEQKLPHPNIQEEWTLERAALWVEQWKNKFADRSQMILHGESLDELYTAVPYAEKAKIKEIYLFTNTWRNEAFWPSHEINWHVRRQVFPKGEADLRDFSDYLAERDIRLNVHYVSGGIGFYDPIYVGAKPDERLATWGAGMLVESVDDETSTLKFKPNAGVELPYQTQYYNSFERFPALPPFFSYNLMRIGDEIIQVGEFLDTTSDTWILTNCKRGLYHTKATLHHKDEAVSGLIAAYGINFIPDNSSSLLEEIADGFAGLINRCRLSHTEYDGAEIHNYNGDWGFRKFTSMVYARLDHAVTAHDSFASAPACHMEYRFNAIKRILVGTNLYTHGNHSVPILLSSRSRMATTLLDAQFALSQGNIGGALGIARPEPMFGVTSETLSSHGLTETMTEALLNWKAISALLTEEDRKRIDSTFHTLPPKFQRTTHPVTDSVFSASQVDDQYCLTSVHILKRRVGDISWEQGQEHGPIAPRQYIKPGDRLELNNPNQAQTPEFIIRVLPAFNPDREGGVPLSTTNLTIDHDPWEFILANNVDSEALIEDANEENLSLIPDFSRIRLAGDTQVEEHKDGFHLFQLNPREEGRYEASLLPSWDCRVDMKQHRGIGMVITGDGSGAIVLLQIPGRDYAVSIDFLGTRYIEIPNGEASWFDDRWGWRMDTKFTRYENVNQIKLGFGYVPPKTKASVKVHTIQALREIQVSLVNPVVSTSIGELRVLGTIGCNQILTYRDGRKAEVYDENWNLLQELHVENNDFNIQQGWSQVELKAQSSEQLPWLEIQIMTKGEQWLVGGVSASSFIVSSN